MPKITIKNVGPIKDVSLDLNQITMLIGEQSTGKSTIAKIISYCLWYQKRLATEYFLQKQRENYEVLGGEFKNRLEHFHRMAGYMNEESFISFESPSGSFKYNNKKLIITNEENLSNYQRSKILYIPAERSLLSIPEVADRDLPEINIRSFLFDLLDASKNYTKQSSLKLLDLKMHYFYEDKKHFLKGNKSDISSYDVLLSNASSGLQALTPLIIAVDNLFEVVAQGKQNSISFTDKENIDVLYRNIMQEMLKKYGMETILKAIEKAVVTNKKSKKNLPMNVVIETYQNIITIKNLQLIIEEPELSLFPSTQKNFMYYLLRKFSGANNRENRLILTTHSPYMLYSLNNCMLSGLVESKMERGTDIPTVDPAKVDIYQVEDGKVNKIQGKDGLLGENYFDQHMEYIMDDFYTLLEHYE